MVAVADPRAALGDLASAVRARFAGRVVGVTGSNGKTTTKELVAAALGPGGSVLRTPGSMNTEVGMPITILSATGDEAFWVLEMAMRGRGEIALLARIAQPQIGVITNVSGAHLERLGSLEEVAHAKGELFHGLSRDGAAVLPAGDRLIEAEADSAKIPAERRIYFDGGRRGDVQTLEVIPAGVNGSVVRYAVRRVPVVVRSPLAGAHNARNGAAALAVALAAGVPIAAAARSRWKRPRCRRTARRRSRPGGARSSTTATTPIRSRCARHGVDRVVGDRRRARLRDPGRHRKRSAPTRRSSTARSAPRRRAN